MQRPLSHEKVAHALLRALQSSLISHSHAASPTHWLPRHYISSVIKYEIFFEKDKNSKKKTHSIALCAFVLIVTRCTVVALIRRTRKLTTITHFSNVTLRFVVQKKIIFIWPKQKRFNITSPTAGRHNWPAGNALSTPHDGDVPLHNSTASHALNGNRQKIYFQVNRLFRLMNLAAGRHVWLDVWNTSEGQRADSPTTIISTQLIQYN